MSDFHQQAIEDVARATGWSAEAVADLIQKDDGEDGTQARDLEYAVAQRERVLEWRRFGRTLIDMNKCATPEDALRFLVDLAQAAEKLLASPAPEKAKP